MDRSEIARLMDVVYGQWPKERNAQNVKSLAKLWEWMLADIPLPLAQRAVAKVLATQKFFPTVAEIRTAALDMADGQPIPWGEAYRMMARAGYNPRELPPLVAETMEELGAYSIRMSTNQETTRAQFRQVYEAKVSQDRELKVLPPAMRAEQIAANKKAREVGDGGRRLGPGSAGFLQGDTVEQVARGTGD